MFQLQLPICEIFQGEEQAANCRGLSSGCRLFAQNAAVKPTESSVAEMDQCARNILRVLIPGPAFDI